MAEQNDNRPTVEELIEALKPLMSVLARAAKLTRLDLAFLIALAALAISAWK